MNSRSGKHESTFLQTRVVEYICLHRQAQNFLMFFSVQITQVVVKVGIESGHMEVGQPYCVDPRTGEVLMGFRIQNRVGCRILN